MTTNTSKFTGVQPAENSSATPEQPVTKPAKTLKGMFAALIASFVALLGLSSPVSAAYSASQSPVALSNLTDQVPDVIAMNGDIFIWALNLVVDHPLLFVMFMLSVMLIVFGAITGLFRRGKKRGR